MRKRETAKISPTAHITAHAWDMLGISNAEYFVDPAFKVFFSALRSLAFPYFANKKNDYVYFMLEPRHRAIDYFIFSKFPYNQIVEFASGLSPRGMTFSENPEITYVESDLPAMIELKQTKVEAIYLKKKLKRSNHKFVPTDLLNENVSEKIIPFLNKEEKLIVITEGLSIYYNMEHLRIIYSNIVKLLKSCGGGVYITDIYHEEDMKNILHDLVMSTMVKILGTSYHTDIDNADEGEGFFKECGFDFVEIINPLKVSKQLGLKNDVPPEKNIASIYLAHVF